MNSRNLTLRTCLLLVALSATAGAQDTRTASQEPEEVRLSVGRPDEYDTLIADLGLAGEQLARFKAIDAQRLEKLKAFVESEQGKQLVALREQLAAARRDKKPADQIAAIREQIKPLSDQYWAIRNDARVALLSTLDVSQQARYVGLTLTQRTLRGWDNLELSTEQAAAVRAICDEVALAWFKPEMVKTDPYFRELMSIEASTRQRIARDVLTDEQRAMLQRRGATSRPGRQ